MDYKKELEEFSYIVSHDLNAPLRHVREFSKLLVGSLEGKVSEEEKLYLQYVTAGTLQIERMIEALLLYSRLDTQASHFQSFDFRKLFAEVLELIDGEYVLKTENLPEYIYGDEGQIFVLIQNIFDNALKFKKPGTTPNLFFKAQKDDGKWLFTLCDEGIGIPEAQAGNVFRIFKSLNPADATAGVGAGLTLCKKIVERHGGRIWVEPKFSEGTKLCFTLNEEA